MESYPKKSVVLLLKHLLGECETAFIRTELVLNKVVESLEKKFGEAPPVLKSKTEQVKTPTGMAEKIIYAEVLQYFHTFLLSLREDLSYVKEERSEDAST